jgi:hypothetical protein
MRRLTAVGMVLASVSLWLVGAQPARATTFVCNELGPPNQGMTANVPGNVSVPDGGQCNTYGFDVGGNITVGKGAKLFVWRGPANASDTIIYGSIIATGPKQLNVSAGSVVYGSVTINGPNPDGANTFGGFLCGKSIGGAVTLQNLTGGRWVIGDGASANDASGSGGEVYDFFVPNRPDLSCTTSTSIGGAVKVLNNNPVQTVEISGDNITGLVAIKNNTMNFERIEVEGNTIGGSLSCSGNVRTDPTKVPIDNGGEPNATTGLETGQCASPF